MQYITCRGIFKFAAKQAANDAEKLIAISIDSAVILRNSFLFTFFILNNFS